MEFPSDFEIISRPWIPFRGMDINSTTSGDGQYGLALAGFSDVLERLQMHSSERFRAASPCGPYTAIS